MALTKEILCGTSCLASCSLLTIRCVLIREHGQVIYTAPQLEEKQQLHCWKARIREVSDFVDNYVALGNIAVNCLCSTNNTVFRTYQSTCTWLYF